MNNDVFEGTVTGEQDENVIDVKLDDIEIQDIDDSEEVSSPTLLLELLSRMEGVMSDVDNDEDDEKSMDADGYHNKAVEYSRLGKNRKAVEVCMEGITHFPLNVDLIADIIKYASDLGDMETATKYYEVLKQSIPFRRWNWRAFTFSFDYLVKDDPVKNEEECREIISNYKKHLPFEEKASMAESELESALGNLEHSMEVLAEAVKKFPNASQSALRLADMQLDRGLFEEVVVTANYGISASAEVQPSINIPYLYFVRTLAKDAILHKKMFALETISQDEIAELADEYDLLINEFPELLRHARTINMRRKMLKFIKV